jgi:hypothetical protein
MNRRFCAASASLLLYTTCGSVRAATPAAPVVEPRNAAANVERDWSTIPKDTRAPGWGFTRSDYVSALYIGLAAGPTSTKNQAPMQAGFAGELTLGVAFWREIPLTIGVGAANLEDPLASPGGLQPCDANGTCPVWHDASSRILGQYFTINTGYQHRFQVWDAVYFVPGALIGYQAGVNQPHASTTCDDCPEQRIPIPDASLDGMYLAPTVRASFGQNGGFIALSVRSQWFVTGDLLQTTLFGLEFIAP